MSRGTTKLKLTAPQSKFLCNLAEHATMASRTYSPALALVRMGFATIESGKLQNPTFKITDSGLSFWNDRKTSK
jgi:hypothetical protein